MGAQLRDVLAAEDSTVVSQENNDGGLADPQRTKAKFLTVHIGQRNHGETAVDAGFHRLPF